jgi:hypothetical protein
MKDVLIYTQNVFLNGIKTVKVSSTTFHLLDCLHKSMKNIPYKTACKNGLPVDEHMVFETCRRREELD